MLLFLFTTFCIALTTGKYAFDPEDQFLENSSEELSWPEQYTVKAVKVSLMSDLTEDIVVWRTNTSSRVDYNEGAVKYIILLEDDDDDDDDGSGDDDDSDYDYDEPKGHRYEIHPESKESVDNRLVCYDFSKMYRHKHLADILPLFTSSETKIVGNEVVIDIETVKFEYTETGGHETTKSYVWATNKQTDGVWVPVKYELTEYNDILGAVTKHEVWYFSDFSLDVDESVFDVTEYNCSEFNPESMDNLELVTKELITIDPEDDEHVEHIFTHFKTKYERQYTNEREHALRRSIFKQNMRLISSTNRKNLPYKLGINQFADKTLEEVKRKHTGLLKVPVDKLPKGNIPFPYTEERLKSVVEELPVDYDARLLGLVAPVLDQGQCGSCWTYSTTAAAEGALARANGGRLLSLSNQALVDCAWGYGAYGCYGGLDSPAYEWMIKFGLPTIEDYGPYKNKEDYCHVTNVTRYPIKGYSEIIPFSESALKVAIVNHGPVAVAIELSYNFMLYSRGVFYDPSCGSTELSHAVTIVGYGVEDGEMFWILKNSWGIQWGEAGYMQISARDNNCGVATRATYVVY